nr:hypothetical protein [Tanacetum cinerariifolium]
MKYSEHKKSKESYDYESQSYDIDDDDCSCDFTYRPLQVNPSPTAISQISGVVNRSTFTEEHGTFDSRAFVFQLENTLKNISDRLKHRIEGIGARLSRLDDETCKLDKYVEDVKSSEERYHETTHTKLRQMQSVLQE